MPTILQPAGLVKAAMPDSLATFGQADSPAVQAIQRKRPPTQANILNNEGPAIP
jgi:hypothetical protein